MKKAASLLLVVIFAGVSLFAQDLRSRAAENPLECALYLLSKDRDSIETDFLPQRLVKYGRYDDALAVIEREDNSYSKLRMLVGTVKELIALGKQDEADRFLTRAFAVLRDDEEWSLGDNIWTIIPILVKTNRTAEALEIISHQDNDCEKGKILIALAEAHFDLGQHQAAEKYLDDAFELRGTLERYEVRMIIGLSLKHSARSKSAEFLRLVENDLSEIEDETERKSNLSDLAIFYFKNGQKDKAFALWSETADPKKADESLDLTWLLLRNDNPAKAASVFKKIRLKKDKSGYYGQVLVNIHLKFDDPKAALAVAREMSEDVDDYLQQQAFMTIVDKLIDDKKTNEALALIDLAFKRAARVGERHEAQDSIGASSLTRKIIYLREIRKRLFKLGRFEQGLGVLDALKIRDSHYQQFYAETLIDYVDKQSKTLPRKKIDELLSRAENVFDADEDYWRMHSMIDIAGIYARIGDRPQAVRTLTRVLENAAESDYETKEMLVAAGNIFEQYKLEADDELRIVLGKIIASVEE